jgi:HAD superfamily hydrolase (TIGR01450 family)
MRTSSWCGAVALDGVRGFVFDVDGTLVHRAGGEIHVAPGALAVLDAVRASARPFVLFTNGSHVSPAELAGELRGAGLPVGDDQLLTPLCGLRAYLERRGDEGAVLPFLTSAACDYLAASGVPLADTHDRHGVTAVFVGQPGHVDFDLLERAAGAVLAGARLLTGSYVPTYAGALGPIFSRGAMVAAAIAKVTGVRPVIVGKPSRAALRVIRARLRLETRDVAVIGDDVDVDIALGRLGGCRTVLVRSGTSATVDPSRVPETRRPHATVEGVAELLDWL